MNSSGDEVGQSRWKHGLQRLRARVLRGPGCSEMAEWASSPLVVAGPLFPGLSLCTGFGGTALAGRRSQRSPQAALELGMVLGSDDDAATLVNATAGTNGRS
ncbi:hypothetical protein H4S01_001647 [Coemansia sp. RSA 2610]|nr:hypothetical protein H4S01_001647 [Coemansia sp. RSA 2610]